MRWDILPNTHEIDYRIIGEEMQCVEIELDPAENGDRRSGQLNDDGSRRENANHFW